MSKSQPVTQSTTQNTSIPAWLTSLSQQAGNAGANLPQFSQYGGANPYSSLTPDQLQALGLASNNAGQAAGVAGSAAPTFNSLTGFQAPQLTAAGVGSDTQGLLNPYIQSVINASNAATDKATAGAQNGVDNNLAAQHAFGGSRQGVADAVVQNQGALTKSNTAANLLSSGYSQAQNTALGIGQGNQTANIQGAGVRLGAGNALAGLGSTLSGINAQDLQGLLSAGGVQQQTNTQQGMFDYQKYLNQYQIPDQQAQTFASILGSLPHNTSTTGTTTGTVYSNPLLGAAGLGLGVAGLGVSGGGTLGGNAIKGLWGQ